MKVDTLSPKLAFLRSVGFSGPEIAEVLLGNPFFLSWSLDRCLTPSVTFLKSILPSKDAVLRVLTRIEKPLGPKLVARINVLKDHGLPKAMFLKLILSRPRILTRSSGDFVYALEYLKKLNFSPMCANFVFALDLLSGMTSSTLHRKLELYKELGWTEEEVLTMFKLQPTTLGLSEQLIRKKVGYFRDTIGWGREFLCSNPSIMSINLEKRIIPRCAVLNVLMSNGLLERNTTSPSKFMMKNELFVEKFVRKYEKIVPGVVEAYEGKTKFLGWDWLKDGKNQLDAAKS